MEQKEIQEQLIATVRDMLLTSCEKIGAQSIEHCWTRHDGTEVKLGLSIHPADEKEEEPEDELYTYARAAVKKFGMDKQVDMAIEEMEDVRIMLAQLDCIFRRSPQWVEKKLAHLKELVEDEKPDPEERGKSDG